MKILTLSAGVCLDYGDGLLFGDVPTVHAKHLKNPRNDICPSPMCDGWLATVVQSGDNGGTTIPAQFTR